MSAQDWRPSFTSPCKPNLLPKISGHTNSGPSPSLPRLTTLGPPQTPPLLCKESDMAGLPLPLPPRLRDNVPSSIYSTNTPRTVSPASSRSRRSSSCSQRSTPASSVTSASDYLADQPNNPWSAPRSRSQTEWRPSKSDDYTSYRYERPVTPEQSSRPMTNFLRTPSPPPAPPSDEAVRTSPRFLADSPPSSREQSPAILPASRFTPPPLSPLRETKPSPPMQHRPYSDQDANQDYQRPLKPSPLQIGNNTLRSSGLSTPRSAKTPYIPEILTPQLPTSRYNPAAPARLFTPRHTPKGSQTIPSTPRSPPALQMPAAPPTPPIDEPEDLPISPSEVSALWAHASLLYHNRRTSDALTTFHDLQQRRGVPRESLARLTLNVGIISTQLARRATTLVHPIPGSTNPISQSYHLATEAFHSAINSHPGGCIGAAGTFFLGCVLFDAGQHAKAADCFDLCEGVFVSEGWAREESYNYSPKDEEVDLRAIGLDYTLHLRDVRANWCVCQERVRIPMGLGTNRRLERVPENLLVEAMEEPPAPASEDTNAAEEGELVFMAFDTSHLTSSPTQLHPATYAPVPAPTLGPRGHTYSNTLPQSAGGAQSLLAPLNTSNHAHATSMPASPTTIPTPSTPWPPTMTAPSQTNLEPQQNLHSHRPSSKLPPGFHRPNITTALLADATRRENAAEMRDRERKKQARQTRMLIRLGDLRLNKPLPPLPYVPLAYSRAGEPNKGPRMPVPGTLEMQWF